MHDEREQVEDTAALFAEHRSYLFAVAYRMLGIAEDAEDAVQDAWVRFSAARSEKLDHPRAYLVTIVTRLCIDLLRSARRRREEYVGVWLPEPVSTRDALPDDLLVEAESASFAFLLLLERLSPLQRAVVVLYDVFNYSHDEVAEAIGRTPAASRQLLRRARLELGGATRPKSPPTEKARELAARFFEAARSGNVEALIVALAPDVVLMGDGGGLVPTSKRPLAGRSRVGPFLCSSKRSSWSHSVLTELNAQPAILIFKDGAITNALLLDLGSEGVTAIYTVRNPHKLERVARDRARAHT